MEENSREMLVSVLSVRFCFSTRRYRRALSMAMAARAGDEPQQRPVVFGIGVQPRRLQVDDADQLAAGSHGHGQLGANGVHRTQIAGIVADVAHQDRLAPRRRRSRDALAHRHREIPYHFVAVTHGIADPQILPPLVEQQDGEQVVRQDAVNDFGNIGQQLVQVERERRSRRHFQQEVQQLGPLAETNGGFARGLHDLFYRWRPDRFRQRRPRQS